MTDPSFISEHPMSRRHLLGGALSAGGAIALSGTTASLLAACGASTSTAGERLTAQDVRDASGTIRMLGFQTYEQPAQNAGQVKAKWTYISSGPEIVTKIRPANSYDVFIAPAFQMGQFFAVDRMVPIDTSVLQAYESIAPVFRDNPTWKGSDGEIYGVPFVYATVYMPYIAAKVPEPKSADDLLRPEFRNAIGFVDDATQSIPKVARVLGKEGDPARITDQEFEEVIAYLEKLRPQVRTLYTSGDEVSLLDRGDISLAMTSYAFALTAGVPNLKASLFASFGFCDGLGILAGADQAAATSWINQALSREAERQLAAAGPLQPVRSDASGALPRFMREMPVDELLRVSPMMTRPPLKSGEGVASLDDWVTAWNDYKASF